MIRIFSKGKHINNVFLNYSFMRWLYTVVSQKVKIRAVLDMVQQTVEQTCGSIHLVFLEDFWGNYDLRIKLTEDP